MTEASLPRCAWQPTLIGEALLLRPLRADEFDALFAVAADPLIWEQHPEPTRYREDVFRKFFDSAVASGGALLVTDRRTGEILGSSRYYDHDPAARAVTIGYTFLAKKCWGGATNREMKSLMIEHAFRFVDTVWFTVGRDNHRSRRAMEKIGGRLSHTTEKIVDGVVAVSVHYRIESPKR